MALPLVSSSTMTISPDDFGVMIDAERVVVPQQVGAALRRLSVRNADQFVSFLYMAPDALASALGWSTADVVHARGGLISRLDGKVAHALLHPVDPVDFALGANDPSALHGY